MRAKLILYTWNIVLMYQYSTFCCDFVDNQNTTHEHINDKDQISTDGNSDSENLTEVYLRRYCGVHKTGVNKLICNDVNDTIHLDNFGLDILDTLSKKFPTAFQEHEDVNMTIENDFLAELLVQYNKLSENNDGMNENDENEINNSLIDRRLEIQMATQAITQFSKYIEKSGKRGLKTLAYKVKNLVNPTLYLNHILKVPKYIAALEKYMTFILQKKVRCKIDEEFIILDMLETSIKIFGKASEEISGVIVQEGNITLSLDQIDTIEEAIGLAVFNERKSLFDYICKATFVCRRYPAYSDYIVKLLESILTLQEKYFSVVVDIVTDTILAEDWFLISIMDHKSAHSIALDFESVAGNLLEVRSLMNVVIKHISQRFKIYYINGVEMRNNTKAVRILLDIIDITFHVYDEDIIRADFGDVRRAIIDWGRGKKRDMERILSGFFHDAIVFLNTYWNYEIKEEVKVLIELMITGTSDNGILCDQLFTKGSKIASADHTIYADNIEFSNMV